MTLFATYLMSFSSPRFSESGACSAGIGATAWTSGQQFLALRVGCS
jgi:hypothetical protein